MSMVGGQGLGPQQFGPQQLGPPRGAPRRPIGVALAIEAASTLTGVPLGEIAGAGRGRRICRARYLAALVARRHLRCTTVAIATALRRDHSTVVHGLQTAGELEARDPAFARDVAVLARAVEEAAALIALGGLPHDGADIDPVAVAVRALHWRGTTLISEAEIAALARTVLAFKGKPAAMEAASTVAAERDAVRAAARRVLDAARRWSEAAGYDGVRLAEKHLREALAALHAELARPPTVLPSPDTDEDPT
jgi:hypothetical protein